MGLGLVKGWLRLRDCSAPVYGASGLGLFSLPELQKRCTIQERQATHILVPVPLVAFEASGMTGMQSCSALASTAKRKGGNTLAEADLHPALFRNTANALVLAT